jgi:hypothetical protein
MAAIVSLRELRAWGIGHNELRKIRDGGRIQGFIPRIARLTADATRIRGGSDIQTYTPNNFAWDALAEPDMCDGWAPS